MESLRRQVRLESCRSLKKANFLCEHLSPSQEDGVQAVRAQQTLLELKSIGGEAAAAVYPEALDCCQQVRFQTLCGCVLALSKACQAYLSSLLLPGRAPALSQGNPVLGKVNGPTAWDPLSAFDLCQPLKSPRPQLPAVSSAPGQP